MVRGAEADIIKTIIGRRIHKARRDLMPLSSCSTLAAGSLSPACSKATAFPAPATSFRIRGVISQALATSAAPNTRWPSAYAYLNTLRPWTYVGDAEGGIVCRCNRRINILADPTMHFFHRPSSQGQFIRRHNHIRDAIMDQIGDAIDMQPHEGPHIDVEWEPLVLAHVSITPDPPPSPPRSRPSTPGFANGDEEECIEE